MIASLCLATAISVLPVALSAEEPVEATPRIAIVEVTGPTEGGRLQCGGSQARLALALASGERRRLEVPFSYIDEGQAEIPAAVDWASGGLRFIEWQPTSRAADWARLPASLRRRSIPVPAGVRARPSPTGWSLLVLGFVLAYLFRNRPALAAILGLGVAGCLLGLDVVEQVGSDEASVLEGDAQSGKWLRVSVRPGSLPVNLTRLLRLGALPEDVRLSWVGTGAANGKCSWTAEVARSRSTPPNSRLISCEQFFPSDPDSISAPVLPAVGAPPGMPLASTWLRAASGGALVSHGPWRRGQPLPAPRPDDPPPPGWLAAGLPQGVGVLLGRVESQAGQDVWVRMIGFSQE